MMYRYGFEWEMFYQENGAITLPPIDYPVDGMPGLVELRTYGHHSLEEAFTRIVTQTWQAPIELSKLVVVPRHKFSTEEKRALRKRSWIKSPVEVINLYGKKPKDLKGFTIASLQISISSLLHPAITDGQGRHHPDVFSLFDTAKIIQALDKEFEKEILASGRQCGEYAIKGDRLEYRSLPNTAFPLLTGDAPKKFLDRIKKAINS